MVKQLIIDKSINTDNFINRIRAIEKKGIIINGILFKDCFSIYIGVDKNECEKYSLSYLLNKELPYFSNKITSIFGDNAFEIALQRIEQDFMNIDKKILLYLGKFPGFGFDIDGGSILAHQLIDSLKIRCKLDLVFIRKNNEEYEDKLVNSIKYIEYKDAFNNKFIRRLENLESNYCALKNYKQYDRIITAHVSKFFGIKAENKSFWKRTILFPMFCTSSYKRAGEIVPKEYTELEKIVIENVAKIITPSEQEKVDLCNDYYCESSKITVIPRGINPIFHSSMKKKYQNKLRIVYIGSIKKQKNNIEALYLLNELLLRNCPSEMHFICTIQDKIMFSNMNKYIKENQLEENVFFHFEVAQNDIPDILNNMDINISVSNWETFGRGIFEGISSGLPTFVLEHLDVVKEICGNNFGVSYSKTFKEMAIEIQKVCNNLELYNQKQNALKLIARSVSYKNEQKLLLENILNDI